MSKPGKLVGNYGYIKYITEQNRPKRIANGAAEDSSTKDGTVGAQSEKLSDQW